MRPVRLTMQAFGPYAGREVVDFREAVASGLFGIYGSTGSGKSSIFSAMTFALFGEAAKAEQDTPSLRSDHAAPDLPTEVEFVFDVGDKRYTVRRRPEQSRPKQRGEGETRDAHEAWLFDATGLALEDISDARPGKVLAEKKISAVRGAVTDILGYGPEQFRQIVLLPQGKFEAFLAAKTDVRLGILRELFDVSLYRRLAAKLKEDAAVAERRVRDEREVCARRLASEGFESTDALGAGIAEAEAVHGACRKVEQDAVKAVEAARKALEAARKVEELFRAAEKAKADLDGLLARKAEIEALQARVDAAARAETLLDVERHFREAESDRLEVGTRLEAMRRTAEKAGQTAADAEKRLAAETARADEVADLRRDIESLHRYRSVLDDAAGLESDLRQAVEAYKAALATFEAAKAEAEALAGKKRAAEDALKLARRTEARRGELMDRLNVLKAACQVAEAFEKATRDVDISRTQVERATATRDALAASAAEARQVFEDAEARLAAAQAAHLAATLRPGEACPVCGATDHPAPAAGSEEHAGLDQAFRAAREAWRAAEGEAQDATARLASAKAVLREREQRLGELERPDRSLADLRADRDEVAGEIAALGAATDISAAEGGLEALGRRIVEAEQARDERRATLDETRTRGAAARARLDEALSRIPEAMRQRRAIEAAITEKTAALTRREAALRSAEEAARASREAALAAKKDVEAAEAALVAATERRDGARTTFDQRLTEKGFSEADYVALKPSITGLAADRATLETHRHNLALAKRTLDHAEEATRDRERPDLAGFDEALGLAEAARSEATDRRAESAARLDHLRKLSDELADTLKRLQDEEAKSAPLRDLANLFNAENTQRIDLETFAIGAMFDQVLDAANQRLGPMTAGRYTLERELEGAGRARRGLGIRVFDLYTGKARATATLSGGETFIAALALALGLSDVVESVSGKVRLDTIFIDEGFGSLDADSGSGTLDQVLQVLNTLVSQRRAVGLISHVPLVREAIPNGFWVRKDLLGSHVEARGFS